MEQGALHLPDVEWTVTRPFWAGCREGILRMPRCACGAYVWYPQPRCPACRGIEIEWQPVSGNGKLFTWTTVYRSFIPAYAERVPYITGIVELVESPSLRLTSLLVGTEQGRLAIGLPVRVQFEKIADEIVLPVFTPATS